VGNWAVDSDDNLVLVGEITAPFGIRGEVKFFPFLSNLALIKKAKRVLVRLADGTESEREIVVTREHHGNLLLLFDGLDRNAVEILRKAQIFLPRSAFPKLPEDEYYEWQLLGLAVQTQAGSDLGKIARVLYNTLANDVYETELALIPAHRNFVLSVDLEAKKLIVSDDPGLLKNAVADAD
jgi:16S rRNA processing protein RimM